MISYKQPPAKEQVKPVVELEIEMAFSRVEDITAKKTVLSSASAVNLRSGLEASATTGTPSVQVAVT